MLNSLVPFCVEVAGEAEADADDDARRRRELDPLDARLTESAFATAVAAVGGTATKGAAAAD